MLHVVCLVPFGLPSQILDFDLLNTGVCLFLVSSFYIFLFLVTCAIVD